MLGRVSSGAVQGIRGYGVEIEAQVRRGLPAFHTVGLPEAAVREARMRVRSALEESGYRWPAGVVTVNLAPADVRKEGAAFDLPMALAILASLGMVPADIMGRVLKRALIVGELGLAGEVRRVRGVLALALAAKREGFEEIIVPEDNAAEAALVESVRVFGVRHLRELILYASGGDIVSYQRSGAGHERVESVLDLQDVRGQEHARRALEVAAAGGHNLLFVGPPGSGKTMLARRLPTILPSMSFEESLELTTVYSVAGLLAGDGIVAERPFRAPHHTISDVGLVGGGSPSPRPGEVSLSHRGVLFLDELPEFKRNVLEVLRQPLEDHHVSITRRLITVNYPAQFMLVASMNACPCGYLGSMKRQCRCSNEAIARYRARISGPLLDRIDIQVEVPDVSYRELRQGRRGESSVTVRERVERARQIQRDRLTATRMYSNAQMGAREISRYCRVGEQGHQLLERVVDRLGMSARACARILKVSRTIADLDGCVEIATGHIAEAIGYRALDRSACGLQRAMGGGKKMSGAGVA